jgi:hypothetical protein
MDRETIWELYKKEREYEETIFGDYSIDPALNVASLLLIIETYLDKAKQAYVSNWVHELPDWLISAKENDHGKKVSTVPVGAYEELIKVHALSGAALEAFADINPNHWREDGIKDKWNINIGEDNIERD